MISRLVVTLVTDTVQWPASWQWDRHASTLSRCWYAHFIACFSPPRSPPSSLHMCLLVINHKLSSSRSTIDILCCWTITWYQEQATRVRACNYIKIETGRNFPPVLKVVTRTVQLVHKMLMLLSVHGTSVLFLVQFNNFALTMGVTRSYSSRPFLCALDDTYNKVCQLCF